MRQKTWPYGTEFNAEVLSATKDIIAVKAENGEGFLLLGHGEKPLPKEGDSGKIVFTRGGVTGGYWKWHSQSQTPRR